jgi:hypothetical protein
MVLGEAVMGPKEKIGSLSCTFASTRRFDMKIKDCMVMLM